MVGEVGNRIGRLYKEGKIGKKGIVNAYERGLINDVDFYNATGDTPKGVKSKIEQDETEE